jgi:phosphatidylglycerophosphatase A
MSEKSWSLPIFDWRRPHHWLAYGFGSGLLPWMPGTAGTLVAVPLYTNAT